MKIKSQLAVCFLATIALAGCQQPTPEEIEQRKRDREAVTRVASSTYLGVLPQIGQACIKRIEGKNPSFDFLVKKDFEKGRGFGRDFYQKIWTVGDQSAGVSVVLHPDGCMFNLPTNGTIDPQKHRASLVSALRKQGYAVSADKEESRGSIAAQSIVTGALFGASVVSGQRQLASRGPTKIELKSTRTSSQHGHAWTEYFVSPSDD